MVHSSVTPHVPTSLAKGAKVTNEVSQQPVFVVKSLLCHPVINVVISCKLLYVWRGHQH